MNKLRKYCFIPFVFYETESYAATVVMKHPIKVYKPIRVEIAYIDHHDVHIKFPLESIEAINALRELYSDYISENITRNSVMKVNELDCFETFEEAYNACKQLTNNFTLMRST